MSSVADEGHSLATGVRVKGQSVIAFERALKELQGPEAMSQLLPHVPEHVARAVQHGEILTIGWYPMEWFASLHTAAQQVFGASISRQIGRTATRHDVTTIYRFILKFLSPDTLVKQYPRLFGLFCETGTVHIEEQRKGFARLRCGGCAGASKGVWEDVVGSTETLLELTGASEPTGRVLSMAEREGAMTFSLSWNVT